MEEDEGISNTVIIISSLIAMLLLVAIVSGFVLCLNAKSQWAVHVGNNSPDKKKKKKKKEKAKKQKVKKEPSTRTAEISNSLEDSEPSQSE